MYQDYSLKDEVPRDARVESVNSEFVNLDSLEMHEYQGTDEVVLYIEATEFENMLGYTLDEVCEWLDTHYDTNFQDTAIDDFEYTNGQIKFNRKKRRMNF